MDSPTLCDVLSALLSVDGRVDIPGRRTQIKDLVADLLPSEIRFVQEQLKEITFVRDFVPELPIEIIFMISQYLDLADLLTVRKVSRAWFEKWTSISLCNKLMKDYFRSDFETYYCQLPEELKPGAWITVSDRLHAMRNGDYHTMRILRYDQGKGTASGDLRPVSDRRYFNGKVAWLVKGGIQLVTLSTGVSRIFMTPNRDDVAKWVLSDQFLVAGISTAIGSAHLYAWPLESNDDVGLETVRLPTLPSQRITIHNSKVAVVTSNREVFIWSIGGQLRQMTIKEPIPSHDSFRRLAVLFHPESADITFIVFLTCKKVNESAEVIGTVRWTVQKYVGESLTKSHEMEYPLDGLDYRSEDALADSFSLMIQKMDDNGNWSLGPVPVYFASSFLDLGCDHSWDQKYRRHGHRHLAHYVTFNVNNERLSTIYYHLPGGQKDPDNVNYIIPQEGDRPIWKNSHLWDGLMLLPVVKMLDAATLKDARWSLPVTTVLLMAIKSCNQISGPPSKVRYIAGYNNPKDTWTTDGRFTTRDLGLMYCWVGDTHLAMLQRSAANSASHEYVDNLREIHGDGKFVVLFGQYDFVVWCYDQNIQLPGQG